MLYDSAGPGRECIREFDTILVVDADKAARTLVAGQVQMLGFTCCAVDSSEAALVAVENDEPALAVVAVELPGLNGLGLLNALQAKFASLPIILISAEHSDPVARAAGLMLGAEDYLIKPLDPAELTARMHRSLRRSGRPPVGGDSRSDDTSRINALTPREREILLLLAEGETEAEIAAALVISPRTVATHIQNVLRKLRVRSRTEAVVVAYREGLVATAGTLNLFELTIGTG